MRHQILAFILLVVCVLHPSTSHQPSARQSEDVQPAAPVTRSFSSATVIGARESGGLSIANGIPWAWGSDVGDYATPVTGFSGTAAAADGGSGHAVLRDTTYHVFSFGDNAFGQLGDGTTANKATPVALNFAPGVLDNSEWWFPQSSVEVLAVAAGTHHSAAIVRLLPGYMTAVVTWGRNDVGQLGRPTSETCTGVPCGSVADLVVGDGGVRFAFVQQSSQVSAGGGHTLMTFPAHRGSDFGVVFAWGDDAQGQLGDGEAGGFRAAPAVVRTQGEWDGDNDGILENVVAVAAGGSHSLALAGSSVWAWGDNTYGQLGREYETVPSQHFARPCGLHDVESIAAGTSHSLALRRDGTVWAWGRNHHGQLGNATIGGSEPAPVRVVGVAGATAIAAKGDSSYALLSSGSVIAWGANGLGQLGDGTRIDESTPVEVLRVNTPPVAADDTVVVERTRGQLIAPGWNAEDAEHDVLTPTVVSPPSAGTLTPDIYRTFLYRHTGSSCTGSDSFTYVVNDGSLDSNVATVTIQIRCAPVANPDNYTADAGTPLRIDAPGVLANDIAPSGGDLLVETTWDYRYIPCELYGSCHGYTAHGRITYMAASGAFEYRSDPGFSGEDSFFYPVGDGMFTSYGRVTITVSARDSTPPTIDVDVTPPPNAAGWNNASPTVTWAVADAESGIATSAGCDPANITADTSGLTLTCSATNGEGLTASASVTVKLDTVAPSVNASRAPAANASGWNNADVTVTFTCQDERSGVTSCTGPQLIGVEGAAQSVTGTAADAAGNSASVLVADINIDKTPPAVTPVPSRSADVNGWYNRPFDVGWSGVDGLSGVTGCIGTSAYGGPDVASGSLSGTCEDRAGNTAGATFAFKFDGTAPAITVLVPADGAAFLTNEAIAASYICSDAVSGIATCAGPTASGSPLDTTVPGSWLFVVNATDSAGNGATLTNGFTVRPKFEFRGFFPPLANLPALNSGPAGRTFPVKFAVLDASGALVGDPAAIANIRLVPGACAMTRVEVAVDDALVDVGGLKYDPLSGTWHFNLPTTKGQAGCWMLEVRLSDGTVHSVGFELR